MAESKGDSMLIEWRGILYKGNFCLLVPASIQFNIFCLQTLDSSLKIKYGGYFFNKRFSYEEVIWTHI